MSSVRGSASRAESNTVVGSLNLHDWCFRLARQAPSLIKRPREARVRLRTSGSEDSVKPLAHRPQPRARFPRELRHRLWFDKSHRSEPVEERSEDLPPRSTMATEAR